MTVTRSANRTSPGAAPVLRPQVLMLMLFGDYVLDRDLCVNSASIIELLGRLDVSEHATRSTLTRMVNRGLLRRRRYGRTMYFGLTPRAIEVLHDGQRRIWETGAVNDTWDGTWTLLCFSLPESWQRQRHGLRSELAWAGFGPLQGGLWIAPGHVGVEGIVSGLRLEAHVRVFRARADELTDVRQMIGDAYDLDGVAARYEDFLLRWEAMPVPMPVPVPASPGLRSAGSEATGATRESGASEGPGARASGASASSWAGDPVAARLTIVAEWMLAIRRDPRLPVQHLPPDWPAVRAQALFRRLETALEGPARAVATPLLDTMPADG